MLLKADILPPRWIRAVSCELLILVDFTCDVERPIYWVGNSPVSEIWSGHPILRLEHGRF